MEVAVRDSQRLIKIDHRWIERQLRKAVRRLIREAAPVGCSAVCRAGGKTPERGAESCLPEVSVLLVNDRRMRHLNLRYRGLDKTTDVLSFPQTAFGPSARGSDGPCELRRGNLSGPFLFGDIVINLHQAQRDADAQRISLKREVSWLLVHGLLHLLGYDHEKGGSEERKMRRMEQRLLGGLR
jgi:rRNA maturation RNase YbeY